MSSEVLVRGRKDYSCEYCAGQIKKGEEHFKVSIFPWSHHENDSFSTWRIHKACKEPGDKFYWDEDAKGIFPEHGAYSQEFKEYLQKIGATQ